MTPTPPAPAISDAADDVCTIDELIEFQRGRAEAPFWQDAAILSALEQLKTALDDSDRIDWLEEMCTAKKDGKTMWMSFGSYDNKKTLREAIDLKRDAE